MKTEELLDLKERLDAARTEMTRVLASVSDSPNCGYLLREASRRDLERVPMLTLLRLDQILTSGQPESAYGMNGIGEGVDDILQAIEAERSVGERLKEYLARAETIRNLQRQLLNTIENDAGAPTKLKLYSTRFPSYPNALITLIQEALEHDKQSRTTSPKGS